MKPAPGVALGGRYRLASRIAIGGMGEVWVAHDESLARDVAVKVLREEFAGDAGFLERFRTEARNSAGLSHPNIAALYDYGEQEGSGFLVMELVLGEPMSDLLDRQPVLPTMRLLPILAQTARALHAAHAGGVVHRDVKPGNIILARSGRVKITDFGISTATNQVPMTASGMVMGTAQYLSPEQAVGKAATPASDIYSLGIVAYEALVGHRPFTGPTAVDIAVAHVNQPVPPMPDAIDKVLAGLVMQMLDKNPENRPRSAASLARALDGMLERTPPGGVPVAGGRHSRPVDILHTSEIEAQRGVVTVAGRPARASELDRPVGPPGASAAGGAPPTFTPAPAQPDDDPWGDAPTRTNRQVAPPPSASPGDGTASASAPPSRRRARREAERSSRARSDQVLRATSVAAGQVRSTAGRVRSAVGPVMGTVGERVRGSAHAVRVHAQRPVPTGTSTGRRWGRLTWPLLALVLMVVFALLGAVFADRMFGASGTAHDPPSGGAHVAVGNPDSSGTTSGMIGVRPGTDRAQQTTTAKDL